MARDKFLPYALPLIEQEEIDEVADTLRSGWITKGPKTAKFEQLFAEYVGAKHAIAMNSATAALHVGLVAKGIGLGDEVITTPMTFCASANTILHAGATPVFVDIDPATMNIDSAGIESSITPRTKAIIPVHVAGYPCDMDTILGLTSKYGLYLLEDGAHAVYTKYKSRMIGSIGDATAFSFYATKNLSTAEGGMLTTDDDELADRARVMSLHGMSRNAWNRYSAAGSWFYEVLYPGFKYNMTDIQASLGIHQLAKLERLQKVREEYASQYNDAFAVMPEIETPTSAGDVRHAWHLYIIKLNLNRLSIDRNQFIEELRAENIGVSVHFIPVHLHPYYRERFGYKQGDFPNAETVFDRIISLPLYPAMNREDVQDVISAVKRVVGRFRK